MITWLHFISPCADTFRGVAPRSAEYQIEFVFGKQQCKIVPKEQNVIAQGLPCVQIIQSIKGLKARNVILGLWN
jgi:hypothetical protein